MKKRLLGIGLVILAIWGGSFALHLTPVWMGFASFSTAILLFVVGFALFVESYID